MSLKDGMLEGVQKRMYLLKLSGLKNGTYTLIAQVFDPIMEEQPHRRM
jgi:hypothetical protein